MGKIYHDFPNREEMGPLDIAAVNRAVFRALKPNPEDTRTQSVFDPSIRDRTDRFVFKFRKPL
jgi:predicted methyltransferase